VAVVGLPIAVLLVCRSLLCTRPTRASVDEADSDEESGSDEPQPQSLERRSRRERACRKKRDSKLKRAIIADERDFADDTFTIVSGASFAAPHAGQHA